MKKRRSKRERPSTSSQTVKPPVVRGNKTRHALGFGVIVAISVSAAVWMGLHRGPHNETATYTPPPPGTLSFNKDIAPIIFNRCAGCHRPGQAAPFDLLSYADVRKHAKQIVEVTERRYMPPWLPEPGCGEFANARRLTVDEIGRIRQWVEEGTPEGTDSDLPPLPRWTEGWQLGEPDLVVTMPQPYRLPAEGRDVYRNFVIPLPLSKSRYIRAWEFRPGNWKAVHHAFIRFDASRDSRRRDEADPEPGFEGIHAPPNAQTPPGHFLSWQPGKVVSPGSEGLSWRLETNTDLVLQLHMRPTGKPEELQASVGFYFTDQAPTNTPIKIGLSSYTIDIPAGKKDYLLEQTFTLPADVEVLGVLPHAHYLGKDLEAHAVLPDGTKQCLIWIKDWDFNWQGDYYYSDPLFLPKGTVIKMRYTYDNSGDNPRNPRHPPERVRYGPQSTDEMGELWLQLLPRNAQDLQLIRREDESRQIENSIAFNEYLLRQNPADAKAEVGLGKALLFQGRHADALEHFRKATRVQPGYDEGHYYLGVGLRTQKKIDAARAEFEQALKINPNHSRAHGNLGIILLEQGSLESAESHFQSALRLDPNDKLARDNLRVISESKARLRQNQ